MTGHPDYAAEARRILEGIPEAIEHGSDEEAITRSITMNTRIATAFALLDVAAAIRPTAQPEIRDCPSRYSIHMTDKCMLQLGHPGKHESPNRRTW